LAREEALAGGMRAQQPLNRAVSVSLPLCSPGLISPDGLICFHMNRIDWPGLLAGAELIGVPPAEVSGVYYDSRAVTPGSLFVAVPGAMPPVG